MEFLMSVYSRTAWIKQGYQIVLDWVPGDIRRYSIKKYYPDDVQIDTKLRLEPSQMLDFKTIVGTELVEKALLKNLLSKWGYPDEEV
jgi:hypothetical protein